VAGAKIAVQAPRRFRLPPKGLVKIGSFLEDLQFRHASSSPGNYTAG
jgi:hypothetical protein